MGRFTGERRALAAAVLAFYSLLFLLNGLMLPGEMGRLFSALSGVYGLGFFALVAGYFWARWYAVGIGISGFTMAVMAMIQLRSPEPIFVFWGGTHLFVSGVLWGKGMAGAFDGRTEWRERFHMDEHATNRLGKSVIRAGVMLPYIVMYALAPRQGGMEASLLLGLGVAVAGTWALFRLRTWSLFAFGSAAAMLAPTLGDGPQNLAFGPHGFNLDLTALGVMGIILLAAAAAPLVGPATRYLLARGDE